MVRHRRRPRSRARTEETTVNEDSFFRALIAALRLADREFVDTRNDDQHRRFAAVVERIDELVAQGEAGAEDLPQLFVPSPVTDRFPELDDALLEAQRGLTGAKNPFYPGADLMLTKEYAEQELDDLSLEHRRLIEDLARAFISGAPAPPASV